MNSLKQNKKRCIITEQAVFGLLCQKTNRLKALKVIQQTVTHKKKTKKLLVTNNVCTLKESEAVKTYLFQ